MKTFRVEATITFSVDVEVDANNKDGAESNFLNMDLIRMIRGKYADVEFESVELVEDNDEDI